MVKSIQLAYSGQLALPERGSFGGGDAVAFGVQVPSDLHSVTGLALLDVLVHGGLQQVCVLPLGLPHPHNTFCCRLNKHGGLRAFHVRPHFVEKSDFGTLEMRKDA